ncbi:MAG TPA: asparagine synthase-related protein [Sphingomonadaceae bacterium]|nr:asparagine synthase-related protein [Sphingomonadaceae bacterium]
MIFLARNWGEASPFDPGRAATSLGIFAGHPADSFRKERDFFAELPAPRAKPRRDWQVARAPGGFAVMLAGWIDNCAELAAALGSDPADPYATYGAAVEKWGDDADRHCVGTYASIACLPDETVRLARSPWASKSLFYHAGDEALLACSILRPIFAAGLPKHLRQRAVDDLLSMELPEAEQSPFAGVEIVPQGSVVLLERGKRRIHRWYDPLAIPQIRLPRDEDYVVAANALLAEAVGKALAMPGRIGIGLSGGLDSPLVCAEALRQLPEGERLPSFTFTPIAEWDGKVVPHKFGDDRPFVEQFAAMHPALDPTFVDNRGIGFDDRAEELFLASDTGYPARVLASVQHGVMAAARDRGCDWLMQAHMGNTTYSGDAPWAYREFLLAGRWRQLWRLAASRVNDPRSIPRRIAAHALMPLLPSAWRHRIRRLVHRGRGQDWFSNPFLRRDGRLGDKLKEARINAAIMTVGRDGTRRQFIASQYHAAGLACEDSHAYEQVFGLRLRDVAAYRPLIEFCLGLPTDQFVCNGTTRWLARRMAEGRLPEAQRNSVLFGEHNVDWHARLTPRLAELRAAVVELADHPDLGPLLDTNAMLELIDDWPSETPDDHIQAGQFRFYLPAMLYVARYVDFETGRN